MDGNPAYESNYGQLYYDYPQQRIRVDILSGKTNLGGSASSYSMSIWMDYKNQLEYILDRTTNECTSVALTTPISGGQLPSNANYGGALLLGSQPVHEYFYPQHYEGKTYQFEVGLMSGTCLPYNVEIFNTTTAGDPHKLLMSEALWNVIPLVPAYVMDVPSQCTTSSPLLQADLGHRIESVRHSLRLHALTFSGK